MPAFSADEPEALLVLEPAGAVTDLPETFVQQHLLGVRRDQSQVGPANLEQHGPVPGLVTAAGGRRAITVILRLAGADWKY